MFRLSSKGKVSYDKIQQQLDNIEGITSALNKAFQGELTAKKEASAKAKKAAQNARKKEREEREGRQQNQQDLDLYCRREIHSISLTS